MGFMFRGKLAHELALRVMQSGLFFKRSVNLQEAIIDGPVVGVKNHFNDAKTFEQSVE